MKNTVKFIFTFLLMMGCFLLFGNDNVTEAAVVSPITGTQEIYTENNGSTVIGRVLINSKGAISIQYMYGFSELLVEATVCSKYGHSDEEPKCESFDNGKTYYIHMSGDFYDGKMLYDDNTGVQMVQKQIHLIDYFDYDEIVRVRIITSFMNSIIGSATMGGEEEIYYDYSGPYTPLFCNVDSMEECIKDKDEKDEEITARRRVQNLVCDGVSDDESTKEKNELEQCYIKANGVIRTTDGSNLIYKNITDSRDTISKTFVCNYNIAAENGKCETFVYIDNSRMDSADEGIESLIRDNLVPTLIVILVIAAGVAIAILGYQIIKSADEPEERQSKIKALKGILIGIAIALLLLFIIDPMIDFINNYIEYDEK